MSTRFRTAHRRASSTKKLTLAAAKVIPTELAVLKDIFRQTPGSDSTAERPTVVTFCWYLLFFSRSDEVKTAAAAVGQLLLRPKNPFVLAHARTEISVGNVTGREHSCAQTLGGRLNLGTLRIRGPRQASVLATLRGDLGFCFGRIEHLEGNARERGE